MGSHFLKLNDIKTEFVLFCTDKDISRVTGESVSTRDTEMLPSYNNRNIGSYLDSEIKMTVQIASIVRACYCKLRSIAEIFKNTYCYVKVLKKIHVI